MPVQCTCSVCGTPVRRKPSRASGQRGRIYCSNACKAQRFPVIPPIPLGDGTSALIALRNRNGETVGYATVEAADVPLIGHRSWLLSDTGYAIRSGGATNDSRSPIRMHRELLGLVPGDGLEGDHINRDKLDNRRGNLRVVTGQGNRQNVPSYRGSSSSHRGVYWDKSRMKWAASVIVNRRKVHLGRFTDEEEAARAARAGRERLLPFAVD